MLTVMAPGTGSQGTHSPDCIASLGVVSLPAHTSSPVSPECRGSSNQHWLGSSLCFQTQHNTALLECTSVDLVVLKTKPRNKTSIHALVMCYSRRIVRVGELYKVQMSSTQGPPDEEQDLKQIYTFSQKIMLKAACQAHDNLLS